MLPAEKGERQLGKILETLAVVRAEGTTPFWHLVSNQIIHMARGTTMILITPSNDEKLFTVVMELVQRGLIPVVILIDQSSFGGEAEASVLEEKLTRQGVMTFTIKADDQLKSALESPKYILDKHMIYKRV
jgi:uncharacterized protein (DUF58 family)